MFNIAIIGRTQMLYKTAELLASKGYRISCIVTSREAPEYKICANDFRLLASKLGCSFYFSANLNSPEILEHFRNLQPDIGVSVNNPTIIKKSFLDTFRLGVLNAHTGDLPRYRGNACPNWAILNGESQIALSIHYMVPDELDSGDIVAQHFFDIDDNTYIGDVYRWMEKKTPQLFARALSALQKDPTYVLKRQSKDPADVLRCYPRRPTDSLIDWRKDAIDIHRLIRASADPFSGAFTTLEGGHLTIWRAELVHEKEKFLAIPGQVTAIEKDSGFATIAAGSGKVRLVEVSIESGKRMPPAAVIRSTRDRLGT